MATKTSNIGIKLRKTMIPKLQSKKIINYKVIQH